MDRSHSVLPRLDFYRKQAKALLKAHAGGAPQAMARFQQHHPRLAGASAESVASAPLRLADAQLVLAREQGFPSWPRFQAHVRDEAARQARTEAADGPATHIQGTSVLVVDDEPGYRETLAELFTGMGFEVVSVATAGEALEQIGSRFFNVALLDIRLPDMRGTELLQRIKAIHRDLIGIMVTGWASVETSVTALNAHAFWYFEKPVDLEKVAEVVLAGLKEQEETIEAHRLLREARGRES
jgi:CheY-like chemotaxis protein